MLLNCGSIDRWTDRQTEHNIPGSEDKEDPGKVHIFAIGGYYNVLGVKLAYLCSLSASYTSSQSYSAVSLQPDSTSSFAIPNSPFSNAIFNGLISCAP